MSVQLFRLRNVPDDEAGEIRQLLSEHGIEFYETPAGNWGISVHALWLNDETQYARAKKLIEEYQLDRSQRVRLETQQKIEKGEYETFIQRIVNRPVQFLMTLAIILLILYLSIVPFLDFGG